MTLRIGSLFSGFEGLGLAVQQVLPDTEIAWVCDNDPAASKVLAHHYPHVPNLGDITTVDWNTVEPVDIITGGSPCQDVSSAGRRIGMQPGTRSGLWTAMADAIAVLRPSLVLFENVRGITSAPAHCDVELGPWDLGGPRDGEPALRALGRVLSDLADIGFDAAWTGLPASDIGAPHKRFRIFLLAWSAADAAHDGRQRGGRHGSGGDDLRTAVRNLVPDANRATGDQRRLTAPGQAQTGGARADAGRRGGAPADLTVARGVGSMRATPRATDGTKGGPNQRGSSGDLMLPSAVHADWGQFAEAVARWETALGRLAPNPTEPSPKDGKPRLSPAFVEWMQGLNAGWVCDVPGLSRNDQLRLLGNGCVPQQVQAALWRLLPHLSGKQGETHEAV